MRAPSFSRRRWLQLAAAGSFSVAFRADPAPGEAAFAPNAILRLLGNGDLELFLNKTEIGQGAPTAMAQILCAELGAEPQRCRLVMGVPDGKRYYMTGGSTSLMAAWRAGRPAAAAMREGLVRAAAQRWGVNPAACEARDHAVHHGGRSLGFGELAADAARQTLPQQPPLRRQLQGLGESRSPAHWPELVQGRLVYGIDVRLPGQRFAVVARAPRIGARLLGFDESEARAVPGVESVLVMPATPWPAEPFVRGGVVVLARNSWAAQQGRARLQARWEGGAAGVAAPHADSGALMREMEKRLQQDDAAGFKTSHLSGSEAALEQALRQAPMRLDLSYEHPLQAHAPLEPMNATARFDAQGRCEVWAPNHNQNGVLAGLAGWLKLAPEQITVHTPWVGGSFGRRLDADYALEAAWVARAAGVPVQLLWTRDDDLRDGMFCPPSRHRIRVALDAQGLPQALSHDVATVSVFLQGGGIEMVRQAGGVDRAVSADSARWPLHPKLLRCRQLLLQEPVRVYWWRRGYSANHCFALESALDEIALSLGHDALDYRLRLLADGELRRWPNGEDSESQDATRMSAVLRQLRDATRAWPAGRWGLACTNLEGTHLAQAVRIEAAGPAWRVAQVLTVVDCGRVVNSAGARAQIEGSVVFGLSAALKGQIVVRDGVVQQRNFDSYPLLRLSETPQLDCLFLDSDQPPSGLGEPAAHPTAAALAAALARATGRRQRSLPLSLDADAGRS